ncbi:MAG: serine/threonine-protein kinase [Pirellulaceae bacterium]|nr:serine/threonine-protein kinase [Pirellulaceae bacterium]
MIANREQCLEPSALNDLLLGRLPPERFASALQHVESCELCTQAAEVASGESAFSWVEKAVKATTHPSFDHEPECQAAVGNLLLQPASRIAVNSATGALPTESLGPYRLLKWLGSGGMGSVYLAEHQRLKRMAAIKLLPREKLLQSGWLDRFNREMTSIAALEHPHVVRAIDAGDEGGWHFLVMEYLEGADLSKVCRRLGDIPLPTACELVRQAALGLGAIHSLGMTHRDVKPSNLFLTRTGQVKLLDLGLVLSGDSPLTADERLTTVGHLMGTVPYMAREQLLDASSVDWRADIYSLGATLFRLLTGRAPFGPASNLAQTIQAISTTPCPQLKSLKPDVPAEVAHLVDRMLGHDPQLRPQSAQEVADSLAPFCDAAAPQSLIRTALSCPDDQDQPPTSQLNFSQTQPRVELVNSGKSKSRWPLWVAAAFVPLAFFAGILITVATDKGTLVIESDEPGVSVNVTQGDKVVESLRVEKQASVLRLQSGKYIVELTGVEGDGLEVSDARVALTRGEKQVVRIQQRRNAAGGATEGEALPADSSAQFQGKPFAYWMDLLDREKDIATIAQAMQAVELLAETEQARFEAARKCMFIARRLGGMVQSGRASLGNANPDASGWFMTELVEVFPKFLPEPGFEVIVEELDHGTERSAQACFLFLSMFPYHFGQSAEPASGFKQLYADMAKSDTGRDQLRKLDKLLEMQIVRASQAAKSPSTVDFNFFEHGRSSIADSGVLQRIDVLNALGEDISHHPQVVEWAKRSLAKAKATLEGKQPELSNTSFGGMGGGVAGGMSGSGFGGMAMFVRSPLDPRTALTIQKALSKQEYDAVPIILAYLEPADFFVTEPPLDSAFTTIAKERPNEAAIAIVKHFERAQAPNGFGTATQIERAARVKLAKETLLANPPDSIAVVKALAHAKSVQDPTSIFKKDDIDDLLGQMAVRLAREANTAGESNAAVKDDIALHVFFQVGVPIEHLSEVAELLLTRERSVGLPIKSTSMPLLFDHINELLGGTANEMNSSYLNHGLLALFERYPKQFIEAYARHLQGTGYNRSRAALFAPLLRALKMNTPTERQLDQSLESFSDQQKQTKAAIVEFLKTDESAAAIQKLDEAYQIALSRLMDTYIDKESNDASESELSSLLYDRLTISRFLDKNAESEPTVRKARIMAGWIDPVLEVEELHMFVKEFGFKSIHFTTVLNSLTNLRKKADCDQIASLLKSLHDSRPAKFRKYFLEHLEQSATFSESGQLTDMFGGFDTVCGTWYYAILKPLIEHPETRDRAIAAIEKIIKHLPNEKKHFLEDLLNPF